MFSGSNKQFSKVFRYSVWPECMTRPRYCCLLSTTTKAQNNFFFAEFALRECLVRNTEVNTFVLGHQHGEIVLPWLVGTKHFPESKNTFQNPKHLLPWDVFLDSGKCFVPTSHGTYEMQIKQTSKFKFRFYLRGFVLAFSFSELVMDSLKLKPFPCTVCRKRFKTDNGRASHQRACLMLATALLKIKLEISNISN